MLKFKKYNTYEQNGAQTQKKTRHGVSNWLSDRWKRNLKFWIAQKYRMNLWNK